MKRTLMQLGIGAPEEMFATSKTDAKVLRQLENELEYRQVPRAVALLEEVQAAMKRGVAPKVDASQDELPLGPPPALVPVAPSPPEPSTPPVVVKTPAPEAVFLSGPQQPRPPGAPQVRAAALPTLPVTLEDACKLLKVTPASAWPVVEQARRSLVQLSHPERVAQLNSDQRESARFDARRVNAAYAALSAARAKPF